MYENGIGGPQFMCCTSPEEHHQTMHRKSVHSALRSDLDLEVRHFLHSVDSDRGAFKSY